MTCNPTLIILVDLYTVGPCAPLFISYPLTPLATCQILNTLSISHTSRIELQIPNLPSIPHPSEKILPRKSSRLKTNPWLPDSLIPLCACPQPPTSHSSVHHHDCSTPPAACLNLLPLHYRCSGLLARFKAGKLSIHSVLR